MEECESFASSYCKLGRHLETLSLALYTPAHHHFSTASLHCNDTVSGSLCPCLPADEVINIHLFSAGKKAAVDVVAF